MTEAYRLTRKDGAPGIDGVTAADYEVNLEANLLDLLDLLDRITSGRYGAPPSCPPLSQGQALALFDPDDHPVTINIGELERYDLRGSQVA